MSFHFVRSFFMTEALATFLKKSRFHISLGSVDQLDILLPQDDAWESTGRESVPSLCYGAICWRFPFGMCQPGALLSLSLFQSSHNAVSLRPSGWETRHFLQCGEIQIPRVHGGRKSRPHYKGRETKVKKAQLWEEEGQSNLKQVKRFTQGRTLG